MWDVLYEKKMMRRRTNRTDSYRLILVQNYRGTDRYRTDRMQSRRTNMPRVRQEGRRRENNQDP